jgi:hypothetical protein
VRRPFNVAATADEAYEFFRRTPMAAGMLSDLDDATKTSALAALHDAFRAHETEQGVLFDSAVWMISARVP